MDIDIQKEEVLVGDVRPDKFRVPPNALRNRIRVLIANFTETPPPVRMSDADILNEFLSHHVPEFKAVNHRIVEIHDQLRESSKASRRRIERNLDSHHARRMEIISETAVKEEFLQYRSEKLARFNDAFERYSEEAILINELKPYLGMPELPEIEASSLSAASILTELRCSSHKKPIKGQMILMLDETVYTRKQFFPRSALKDGIPRALWSDHSSHLVRVPYSPEENLGAEAIAAGAFEKKGRVYFKLEQGKPQSFTHWIDVDRFLPFACRSISVPILPVVMPLPSHFDFAEVFGKDAWSMIADDVLDRHANTCMVCGSTHDVEAVPRWRFREPVKGVTAPGVQMLDSFITMCSSCIHVFRPGLKSLLGATEDGFVLKVSKDRIEWMRLINRWQDPRFRSYVEQVYLMAIDAHRRRSKTNWIVDLSALKASFLKLDESFIMDDSGWISREEAPSFKIAGTAFFEGRDMIRHIPDRIDIFDVKWDITLDEVDEILEKEDLASVNELGQGINITGNPLNVKFAPQLIKKLDSVSSDGAVESLDVDVSVRPTQNVETISGDDEDDSTGIDIFEASSSGDSSSSGSSGSSGNFSDDDDDDDDDDDEYTEPKDYHETFGSVPEGSGFM